MQQKEIKRNSSLELLRIIAMILIILDHANRHGLHFETSTFNSLLFTSLFSHLGPIGNWLFFLISVFFLKEESFSWNKVLRLWLQVFSTSVIIGVIVYITQIPIVKNGTDALNSYTTYGFTLAASPASIKEVIVSVMPCYFSTCWYATAYLVFFMLMPFLDLFLKTLSQDKHRRIIILMSILGTVITIFPGERFFIPSEVYPFILAFFIAKYIKLYKPRFFLNVKYNIYIIILGVLLLISFKFGTSIILPKIGISEKYSTNIITMFDKNSSFPIMMISLSLFSIFLNIQPFYSKIINVVASSTFGIFLIHANVLLKYWIWHKLWNFDRYTNCSPLYLLGYYFICVVLTFIICCILELIRKTLIERPFFCFVSIIVKRKA